MTVDFRLRLGARADDLMRGGPRSHRSPEGVDVDPDPREVLRAFGRACLDRFAEECGGLNPAVLPDPRHVACLLLEE